SKVRPVAGRGAEAGSGSLIESARIRPASHDRERIARLKRDYSRDLPPAEQCPREAVAPSEQSMPRSNRKINHIKKVETMTDIERRRSVLDSQILRVHRRSRFSQQVVRSEIRRVVIERFAERVRALHEEAAAILILRSQHQPVVVRRTDRLGKLNVTKMIVR